MRRQPLFGLLAPVGKALARQLSGPSGWFGREVMTRLLDLGNRRLILATLDELALSPATRLLDVGFGGGRGLAEARLRGVVDLAGADPSAAAVARLRARSRSRRSGRLRIEQAGAEALPFADGAFDAVLSSNTVYFWPDPVQALAEIARVLRPGGRLALGFSCAEKLRGFDAITRHGFHLHENDALGAAAGRAGLRVLRLVALRGGAVEGDFVLVAERLAG